MAPLTPGDIQVALRDISERAELCRPVDVGVAVTRIARRIEELLPAVRARAAGGGDVYDITKIATDYLPGTVEGYLRLSPRDATEVRDAQGRTPLDMVRSQLALLDGKLAEIADSLARDAGDELAIHGRFLESRFGGAGALRIPDGAGDAAADDPGRGPQTDAPPDMDVLLATLRAGGRDQSAAFDTLVPRLEAALPDRITVEREKPRWGRGPAEVRRLSADLDGWLYDAEKHKGRVRCTRRHMVRGICLKTEDLDFDDWLRALIGALSERAAHSDATRRGLRELLG